MITTVTLNPCNDLTLNIPGFAYGGMNRITSQRFDFAGKGFNVARSIARLGEKATATGFLYDENGEATRKSLQEEGVLVDCVWREGKIRTNIKLFDEKKRAITELNESGVFASQKDIRNVIEKIYELSEKSDYLVLSGSLAPGCPENTYAEIIYICAGNCKVILDAEGKKLMRGIEMRPFMIKPNLFELETAVNRELKSIQEIKRASLEIIDKGVEIVSVSLGAEGAIFSDANQSFYAPPVKNLTVRGTVGAGDSMVAGYCVALARNYPVDQVFEYGVAAASDCVAHEGTGLVTKLGLEEMLAHVEIERI